MARETGNEIRAKLKQPPAQVKTVLKSKKGRIAVCACGAAILLLAVILLVKCVGGDARLKNWPKGELMEGIQPPEQGKLISAHQTETTVVVYFEEFPENQLAAYLQTLGASPAGDSTYVAKKGEGRILAVVYDPATELLSLTVTSNM